METGPRLKVSFRKTGEAGDRSSDRWIGSLACYPLHYRRSYCRKTKRKSQKLSTAENGGKSADGFFFYTFQ